MLFRSITALFLFSLFVTHACPIIAADVELIRYRTIIRVDKGRLVRTDTVLLQINNRNGEDFASIQIPYSGNRKLSDLAGRIEDLNGRVIRVLKNQDVLKVSAVSEYSLYTDDYVAGFTLKHNAYPYRIRYCYTVSAHQYLMIADWFPVIGLAVPTHIASLSVTYPRGFGMYKLSRNLGFSKVDTLKDMITETWTASYDGRSRHEAFAPAWSESLPNLKLVPEDFIYGVPGKSKSWQSLGQWQSDLIRGLQALPEQELATVKKLIAPCKNKIEVVRVLYQYMQDHTRYINISMDIGGMKPYPAEYVSINKYGDCKALTNYMKSLLDAAGIPSYYTLTYRGIDPPLLIRELPSQQFNHALLTVPLEHDTIWLENTENTNPFGYIGVTNQNRDALLVDENQSHLIRLPAFDIPTVCETGRCEYSLSAIGKTPVTYRHTFRGINFELYNALLFEFNQQEQDAYINNHFALPRAEILSWKLLKKNRDSRQIRLEVNCEVPGILRSIGDNSFFFQIQPVEIPGFESLKDRTQLVRLNYPLASRDTLIYHLPTGYDKVDLPEKVNISNKYGSYNAVYAHKDYCIILIRELEINAGSYPVAEYDDFIGFLNTIKTVEKRNIQIQR